jgi:VanZ like family
MKFLFTILSIAYIAGIFLFADSPVVSVLSRFNPNSLLHIPLYGILTVLLILSFMPLKFNPKNPINPSNSSNSSNPSNPMNLKTHFLLPGGIALIVAIADEIHQAYVPGRDASITDVLLDMVGISLVLFLFFRLLRRKHRYP